MGFREAFHRLREQGDLYRLRMLQSRRDKVQLHYEPNNFAFCQGLDEQLPELNWDFAANNSDAAAVLAGDWPALGFDWCLQVGSDWRCAPDTGQIWPQSFFSTIPYRVGNPYGDIRVAWEPSRLQQLVSLALLAKDPVHREKATDLFERLLLSWVAENPPYRGIHYVSSMECALRLLSVCHAIDIIRPHLKAPAEIWPAVLALVDSHASLIIRRLSLFSSAGNHTITECAGLIYAAELFPELSGAIRWSNVGVELLEQEASRQFFPDGGGIEQAFGYHLFITDLCNLVARLLAAKNRPSLLLESIVDSAVDFLSVLFSEDWQLPNIGDNDGGYALSRHLRISYQQSKGTSLVQTFAESGYSLINDVTADNRLIVFDHGSLGMAPSYGHGHSDCLSVFWREQGESLLVDPGTFTYTGDSRWRSYFRGVSAHNTVSVDHQDQAVQQSAFIWNQAFQSDLLACDATIDGHSVLLASHTGYLRFGVSHHRALIYNPEGCLLVWDVLDRPGKASEVRDLSLWWQLAGKLEANQALPGGYVLTGAKGGSLQLEIQGGEIFSYSGDENGPHGWNSPKYGEKFPITTLEARYKGNSPHQFYTYIRPRSASIGPDEMRSFNTIMKRLRPLLV